MRYRRTAVATFFKIPFGPWPIPVLGILSCILLLINTSKGTAIRFGIWMGVGHLVYFLFSFRHSHVRIQHKKDSPPNAKVHPPMDIFVIPHIPEANPGLETDEEHTVTIRL